MQGEGERLKNAIRGKGMSIEVAAEKIGMSRQRLGYYLQKAKIGDRLKEQSKQYLSIDIDMPEANEPETDYKKSIDSTKPKLDDLIYFMGDILKLSFSELQAALIKEPDQNRRKVIKEVIQTKEKMQLLEERLKDKEQLIEMKDAMIEQLKMNIKKK